MASIAITVFLFLTFFTSAGFANTVSAINPDNGHLYQRVDASTHNGGGIDWDTADWQAGRLSYAGVKGHLVTITSEEENQWIIDNLGGELTLDH